MLLDTDVFSLAMRGAGDILARLTQAGSAPCRVSAVTLYELRFGIERSPRRAALEAAFELVRPLVDAVPVDASVAHEAGCIRAALEAAGRPVGALDPLIAATARLLGLTLVTRNTKHFEHVDGLALDDWLGP